MADRFRGRSRYLLGLGLMGFMAATPTWGQAVGRQVNRLAPYIESIEATFRMDICGDSKTGGLLRRLIVEQVGKCP